MIHINVNFLLVNNGEYNQIISLIQGKYSEAVIVVMVTHSLMKGTTKSKPVRPEESA
jgi:hypothetical protein